MTAPSAPPAQRFGEFKMPDVGEGLTEAEILKWYVQPGDTVTDGQVVCEVETAKAVVELPIPYDGVVHELRFPEGETVAVGEVIIAVDTTPDAPGGPAPAEPPAQGAPGSGADAQPGSAPPGPPAAGPHKREPVLVGYGVAASSTKRRPRKAASPGAAPQGEPNGRGAGAPGATTPAAPAPLAEGSAQAPAHPRGAAPARSGQPLAKPPVRKLAKDLGIALDTVVPTGPGGVVTRDDVNAAASGGRAAVAPAATAPAEAVPVPEAAPAPREHRVPVKGVRKATAAAMVASAFTAPHVTEFITFDITRTMRLVQELKRDRAFSDTRVSPLLLVAKALLVAIRRNPEVNASWDEENQEIVHKGYVNLGIAAATPRGLIVPNIKDAGAKTLPELAVALTDLITTARDGKTAPADMQGGTVTITNVGVFGVDTGTPILNPGESAIFAFGAVKEQPWVHKGKVKPRQVTTLAVSFDHRLVDGELGSKVLADTAAVLEYPKRLIAWA